eukprot:5868552-Prymnesium_polylepis.1
MGGGVGRGRHGLSAPQFGEVQELLDLVVHRRVAGAFGGRTVAAVQCAVREARVDRLHERQG